MKRDALVFFKNNLEKYYAEYYTEPTNAWMTREYGDNPFVEYKEIPDFIRMAEHFGARPYFWELRPIQYNYEFVDNDFIVEPDHPLHENLKEVLKNPICKKYKDNFTPRFNKLICE